MPTMIIMNRPHDVFNSAATYMTSDLFVSVQRSIHARSPDSLARGD